MRTHLPQSGDLQQSLEKAIPLIHHLSLTLMDSAGVPWFRVGASSAISLARLLVDAGSGREGRASSVVSP